MDSASVCAEKFSGHPRQRHTAGYKRRCRFPDFHQALLNGGIREASGSFRGSRQEMTANNVDRDASPFCLRKKHLRSASQRIDEGRVNTVKEAI